MSDSKRYHHSGHRARAFCLAIEASTFCDVRTLTRPSFLRWRYLLAATALILLTSWSHSLFGQDRSSSAAQIDVSELQQVTVRVLSGDDTASGVFISSEGHVLTVAHGVQSNKGSIRIRTTDDATHPATLVAYNTTSDIAVIRVTNQTPKSWACIELANFADVKQDDIVVSLGFPGRTPNQSSPTWRLGRIIRRDDESLRTSCSLTAGDSGGPLLNAAGQLIGIHRQIGIGAGSNVHVALPVIVEELRKVPLTAKPTMAQNRCLVSPGDLRPSAEVVSVLQKLTYEVRLTGSANPVARATLVTPDFVVTKLSELPDGRDFDCVSIAHQVHSGSLRFSDQSHDLAFIRLSVPATLPTSPKPSESDLAPGRLLFTLAENSLPACGIASLIGQNEPSLPGRLGVRFTAGPNQSIVASDVLPNGAAAMAGMQQGDQLQAINGELIRSLDELTASLSSGQPGDRIRIRFQRDTSVSQNVSARLQHDAGERFTKLEFLDGRSGELSERRSGFAAVIQHDIPIRPADCGGPICDSQGKLIGVNIARRSREATLAIPIERIRAIIEQRENAAQPNNVAP